MEERTSPRGAPIAFHTSFAAANRFDSPTVVEDQTRTLSIVLRYFAGPMLLLRFNPLLLYFAIGPRGRDDRRTAPVIHIPLELHFPIATLFLSHQTDRILSRFAFRSTFSVKSLTFYVLRYNIPFTRI